MIARGRVKRVELAHRSRHGVTGGGIVVGIEDKAAGTVTVGEKVLTAQEFDDLAADCKFIFTRREEEEVTL